MGHKFHELVDEALSVEKELRALLPGKLSLSTPFHNYTNV